MATAAAEALRSGELDSDAVDDEEAHTVGVICLCEGVVASERDPEAQGEAEGEPPWPGAPACAPDGV